MNIALISEAGGGKDLLAERLINNYGFTRYAFADHVKEVAATWFPQLYGDGTTKNRVLLQAIGTKFREIDPHVWISSMFRAIDKEWEMRQQAMYQKEFIVITDCRMPNEYLALKEKGFIFIRVKTDEEIRLNRLVERGDIFSETDLQHHTESHYDEFNCEYWIENNSSIEALYEKLDSIMKQLLMSK